MPDITLAVFGGDIWVEMAVSHPCSAAKRKSRNRIVEITIRGGEDLQIFPQHKLSSSDSRVKFLNFKEQVLSDMCARPYRFCQLMKRVVKVYANGSVAIKYLDKSQSFSAQAEPEVVWWAEEFMDRQSMPKTQGDYDYQCEQAAERSNGDACAAGHRIRACGLCEHYDHQQGGCCQS